MGYTTEFEGSFKLTKPLTEEQEKWFNTCMRLRKCPLDSQKLKDKYKGKGSLDGDYGKQGEFFGYVPEKLEEEGWENSEYGQWINSSHPDMFPIEREHNNTSSDTPSLWCQWRIDGDELSWDGREKFYYYFEWIDWIRKNILSKWGIDFKKRSGVNYRGEDFYDFGSLYIDGDGELRVTEGHFEINEESYLY